mgnify:FL=1
MLGMKEVHVFPLGYDISGIMKIITGLRDGTLMLLLPEKLDERAKSSLASLQAFISGLNARGSGFETQEFRVSFEPQRDISELIRVLSTFESRNFYISGGMRYFALVLYYVASMFGTPVSVILEENSSVVKIPPVPAKKLKGIHVSVLKTLSDGPLSLKQISLKIEKSESTISRALHELQEIDAIARDGRSYRATPVGRALAHVGELSTDA